MNAVSETEAIERQEEADMAQTKTRFLKGTVDKDEYVIEFVIEELSDRELVARALRVDASKVVRRQLSLQAY